MRILCPIELFVQLLAQFTYCVLPFANDDAVEMKTRII